MWMKFLFENWVAETAAISMDDEHFKQPLGLRGEACPNMISGL